MELEMLFFHIVLQKSPPTKLLKIEGQMEKHSVILNKKIPLMSYLEFIYFIKIDIFFLESIKNKNKGKN